MTTMPSARLSGGKPKVPGQTKVRKKELEPDFASGTDMKVKEILFKPLGLNSNLSVHSLSTD